MRRLLKSVAVVTLLGCSGESELTTTASNAIVYISITPTGSSLIVGGEVRLAARAYDSEGRERSAAFEWVSENPAIAAVDRYEGYVTAISPGVTTLTVRTGALKATANVWVRPPDPAVAIVLSTSALIVTVGAVERLTARAFDGTGLTVNVPIEWSSADLTVATVGKTDGVVTGIAVGNTTLTATAGTLRAIVTVSVLPEGAFGQWAIGATASTEWTSSEWSARQAIGAPDVVGCEDDPRAWASLTGDGVDWLELTYAQPVRPSEIHIHEVFGVGSIVKVDVKDESGAYHTVYTAQPVDPRICPRILRIAITAVTAKVSAVRVSIDQRVINYWNEIDAVRLIGYR